MGLLVLGSHECKTPRSSHVETKIRVRVLRQCFLSGTLLDACWHPAKLLKALIHIQPCVCT